RSVRALRVVNQFHLECHVRERAAFRSAPPAGRVPNVLTVIGESVDSTLIRAEHVRSLSAHAVNHPIRNINGSRSCDPVNSRTITGRPADPAGIHNKQALLASSSL